MDCAKRWRSAGWHHRLCMALAGLVVLVPALLFSQDASAQSCTFTIPDVDFGNVDLSTGGVFDVSANMTATCTGIPGWSVRLCPHFDVGSGGSAAGGNPRYMTNGGSQLNYNLFRDSYVNVWGSFLWGFSPRPPQPVLTLDGSGNGSTTRLIRGRIYAGQTGLPPGLYTSTFTGSDVTIGYFYSFFNCNIIGAFNGVSAPFTVRANNIASCAVTSTSLDFGTASTLGSNIDAAATVSITCPLSMAYTISLSNGVTGSGPTNRLMELGAQQVSYGIYRDAGRSNPWGSSIGTNTVAATGTGAVQNFTAYGRVPPQTTPSPGTYSDVVVVTVTY